MLAASTSAPPGLAQDCRAAQGSRPALRLRGQQLLVSLLARQCSQIHRVGSRRRQGWQQLLGECVPRCLLQDRAGGALAFRQLPHSQQKLSQQGRVLVTAVCPRVHMPAHVAQQGVGQRNQQLPLASGWRGGRVARCQLLCCQVCQVVLLLLSAALRCSKGRHGIRKTRAALVAQLQQRVGQLDGIVAQLQCIVAQQRPP